MKSVSVSERDHFKYQAQAWLDAYLYIEQVLKCKLSTSYPDFRVDRGESRSDLAEKLRNLFDMGDHPIPSTIHIVEDFGIYAIHVSTNARIDACAGWLNCSRVVVLNTTLTNDRVRLTALHELAHHLYQDCVEGPLLPSEEIESRAFEFASHMLLPERQLIEAFKPKSMVHLLKYKERFGISLAAMILRARKSNLISQRTYQRIWREFSRLGFRTDEPGNVAADRPVCMETLIDTAVRKGVSSYEKIARIASTDEDVVRRRIIRAMGGTTDETPGEEVRTFNFNKYKKLSDKGN